MQYLAVCANWDNDARGRISEWDIGGVMVVMGDSRRHKDISHAAQNGGCSLTIAASLLNTRRSLVPVTTILGSRGLREAHAADEALAGACKLVLRGRWRDDVHWL